jgi:penicillin-binding protein 2
VAARGARRRARARPRPAPAPRPRPAAVHRAVFPKEWTGAIVALDPQTGGVLAYYSQPTYDPNLFIGGIPAPNFRRLVDDPKKPLLDRVVASPQPAASTWKLVVAGMALDLGVIRPEEYMPQACTGSYFYGRVARCWYAPGHGRQNLVDAIKNSCNVYFYQVGVRIGLKRFLEHGTKLGFGREDRYRRAARAQAELPAERTGTDAAGATCRMTTRC